jgi:lipid-A-disaccharide synthase-like uncharacterized protein
MQEASHRMQRIAFIVVLLGIATAVFATGEPAELSDQPDGNGLATTRPADSADLPPITTQPGLAVRDLLEENAELRNELARLRAQTEQARIPSLWMAIGFLGQFIFGMRFVVQWIVTERRRRSVVPVVFWYLSLAGTLVLLTYSIYRLDPVFIAGFSLNMVIYLRNLYFIRKEAQSREAAA